MFRSARTAAIYCFLGSLGRVAGQGGEYACEAGQGAEACDVSLLQVHLEKEQVQLHTGVEHQQHRMPMTASGLTSAQKDAMLMMHNRVRSEQRRGQPCPAADMEELVWDDGLAQLAQAKAETCRADADPNVGTTFGENIYKSGCGGPNFSTDKVTGAVQDWFDEHRSTEWKRNTVVAKRYAPCGSNVAHYYQLVWAKTKKVGCGAASCSNIEFDGQKWGAMYMVVCRYDVPSKQEDGMTQGLPFIPGEACAACPDSCSAGLCTSTPDRCQGDDCKGKKGIGYEACGAEQPPEFNSNPPSPSSRLCNLPAVPLNAEYICETADGSRSLQPEDVGFFMWGIKEDPEITCRAMCKQFSRGAFGTGQAIRYTQPADRIGIAQVCDKAGTELDYVQRGPQSLIDNDDFLAHYCLPIAECVLPELDDERASYDPNSCTISPDLPRDTAHRYREGEQCNVLCEEGYELDFRFGQRANTCDFPPHIADEDKKILGTRGPPSFTGGEFSLKPECIKKAGENWLSENAKATCQGHRGMEDNGNFGGGYIIHDDDKKDESCPLICLVRTGDFYQKSIIGMGKNAKSRMANKCEVNSRSDSKYTQTILNYCCCAKTACFKEAGSLKDAPASTDMGECSSMHYRPLCDANDACSWDWSEDKCGWDCGQLPLDKCTQDKGCKRSSWSDRCGKDYGW